MLELDRCVSATVLFQNLPKGRMILMWLLMGATIALLTFSRMSPHFKVLFCCEIELHQQQIRACCMIVMYMCL